MKATILLVALIANIATAFDFKEVPHKVSEFVHAHTFTREEAEAIAHKHRMPKLNAQQRQRVNEAHHSIRATREKLGLPRLGAGPNVQENY